MLKRKSLTFKSRHGIPFLAPREWYLRAMQKWAREVRKIQREKDVEIRKLKDRIKELEGRK